MSKIKSNLIASSAPLREASRYSTLTSSLFGLFVACTLAIPAAPLNKVLFALLILWLFAYHLNRPILVRFPSIAPVVIVGIFMYGFILAQFNQVDMPVAVQFLLATLILPLIYFIVACDIDMDKLAVNGSYLLVVCTAIFWISLLLPDLPFFQTLNQFLIDYNMSSATEREFFEGEATFTLALSTAPFLFVGFCVVGMRLISVNRRMFDWFGLLLIFAAIVVSGQRALIGVTLLYTAYLWLTVTRPRYRWLVLMVLVFAVIFMWSVLLADSQVFSKDEVSNQVKIGHFQSYLAALSPSSLLFGNGLASYYYSSGSQVMKAFTELTPIDLCRYFGVPLTLVLYAFLLLPFPNLYRLKRSNYGYSVAIVLYLALSMTNPVMFNSYGLLVVLWYWRSLVDPNSYMNDWPTR